MTRNSRKKLRGNFDETPEDDPKEEYEENPVRDKNLENAEKTNNDAAEKVFQTDASVRD